MPWNARESLTPKIAPDAGMALATLHRRSMPGARYVDVIIWIFVGGAIGWIASLLVHADGQDLLLNIAAGVVGSWIAGAYLFPLLDTQYVTNGALSMDAVLVSLGGAVIFLLVVNLIFRGAPR